MMTEDDAQGQAPANPTEVADERRRARLAQLEADNEHGRQLIERYGRETGRLRRAVVGYAGAKRRRRR
jgi:hypothetical protein